MATKKAYREIKIIPKRKPRVNVIENQIIGYLTVLKYHSTKTTIVGKNNRIIYRPFVTCECHCGKKVIKSLNQIKKKIGVTCNSKQCKNDWKSIKNFLKSQK